MIVEETEKRDLPAASANHWPALPFDSQPSTLPELLESWWNYFLQIGRDTSLSFAFPSQVIYIKDLAKDLDFLVDTNGLGLCQIRDHATPHASDKLQIEGIRIRLWKPKLKWMISWRKHYQLGVNLRTRWITLLYRKQADELTEKNPYLNSLFSQLDLVPIKLKTLPLRIAENQQTPPLDVFLPRRWTTSGSIDSIDETFAHPGGPFSSTEFMEYIRQFRLWQKTDRWLKVQSECATKPSNRRMGWTMESISLDCDGYDEEFRLPSALSNDLRRIKACVAESLQAKPSSHFPYSSAYTNAKGKQRLDAVNDKSFTFQVLEKETDSYGLPTEMESNETAVGELISSNEAATGSDSSPAGVKGEFEQRIPENVNNTEDESVIESHPNLVLKEEHEPDLISPQSKDLSPPIPQAEAIPCANTDSEIGERVVDVTPPEPPPVESAYSFAIRQPLPLPSIPKKKRRLLAKNVVVVDEAAVQDKSTKVGTEDELALFNEIEADGLESQDNDPKVFTLEEFPALDSLLSENALPDEGMPHSDGKEDSVGTGEDPPNIQQTIVAEEDSIAPDRSQPSSSPRENPVVRSKRRRSESSILKTEEDDEYGREPPESQTEESKTVLVRGRVDGRIRDIEMFKEFKQDLVGKAVWWIFGMGLTGINETFLAYNAPTILWNLLLMKTGRFAVVVAECLMAYRRYALEDGEFNDESIVQQVNKFVDGATSDTVMPTRGVRLASLRVKCSSLDLLSRHLIVPNQTVVLPRTSLASTEPKEEETENERKEADVNAEAVRARKLARRQERYTRRLEDFHLKRTELYYRRPRFYRQFLPTKISAVCRCCRCGVDPAGSSSEALPTDLITNDSSEGEAEKNDGEDGWDTSPTDTALRNAALCDLDLLASGKFGLITSLFDLPPDRRDEFHSQPRHSRPHSKHRLRKLRELADKFNLSDWFRDKIQPSFPPTPQIAQVDSRDDPSVKGLHARRHRREKHIADHDIEALRTMVLDGDGFPIRNSLRLSHCNRKQLYLLCAENNFLPAVILGWNDKGRGVYAASVLYKGDFVCEYKGVFYHQYGLAKSQEDKHAKEKRGSYMFFFINPATSTRNCIDATDEDINYGCARLINHSHRRANLDITVVTSKLEDGKLARTRARLIFFASRDIRIGEELLIDYGETNAEVLKANPWLKD